MKLNIKDIDRIISNGPCDIPNIIFPLDENKRHFSKSYQIRKLDNGEQLMRCWLVYSQSTDRAFCFCCRIFNRNPISALSISGYNDWKHMSDIVKQHEWSTNHFTTYSGWIEIESRLKLGKCIDKEHQRIMDKKFYIGKVYLNISCPLPYSLQSTT